MLPLGDTRHQTEQEVAALDDQLAGERAWLVFFHDLLGPFVLPAKAFVMEKPSPSLGGGLDIKA